MTAADRAPDVIAHRGARHAWPDNTMAAFEAALIEGADGIECDVQTTRDRELVLIHDLLLADGRHVAELSKAELGEAMPQAPRLADLLAWRRTTAPSLRLLVEIKDPNAVVPIAEALAGEPPDRTWLGGFHGPALAAARTRAPALRTSLMVGSVVDAPTLIDLARRFGCTGVHPCWEARAPSPSSLLDPAAVAAVRAGGLRLTLWHEEREDELRRLVALGVDAICTDTPGRLRWLIESA